MFGKVIYFDEKKIHEYSAVINGGKEFKIDTLQVSNEKKIGGNFKLANAGIKQNDSYTCQVMESLIYDLNKFENSLVGRDDYFDFIENTPYLNSIGQGNIIRFDSYMYIPKEFDIIQLIAKFKNFIPAVINSDSPKDCDDALLSMLFGNNDFIKIPIITELDDEILCSKLTSNNLVSEYEELEEYEDEEVTILARVKNTNLINKSKAYYDPLKDFMSLNRMMRKSIEKDRGEEFNQLFVKDNYRNLEILAIYQ